MGHIKRFPSMLPEDYRTKVMKLSKADIAEILWDELQRFFGETNYSAIWQEIEHTNKILKNYR